MKKFALGLIAFSLAGLIFLGGVTVGQQGKITLPLSGSSSSSRADLSTFWEAWNLLDEIYLHRPIDEKKRVDGAIHGMVSSLGDPYTAYMDAEETQQFDDALNGSLSGVGIELGQQSNAIVVIAPLPDSPAMRAGIKPKDVILEVDGASIEGLDISTVVSKIRGEAGTRVSLTIYRESESSPRVIDLVRETINISSVSTTDMGAGIWRLEIRRFGPDTEKELSAASKNLVTQSARGIILDLRNNPGGYLDGAIDAASYFIRDGIVVTQEGYDGKKTEFKVVGHSTLSDIPVVVLMNGGSASASEILAGALHDRKNIPLIGEQSFGKGTVQELRDLGNGGSIRITIAQWLTPNGISISEKGLTPDIEVRNEENTIEDAQLDRALLEIKGKVK